VVEVDLSSARPESLPGWNLFELTGDERTAAESRVEAIVDAFASTLQWGEQSTRAINLTTQAAGALARIAPLLSPELAPTIFQLPTLLSNERWRAAVLPFLPKASQGFWIDRFPLLAQEAITPLTNLVDRLRHSTPISALLGQSQSTYRVREAMDAGQIVLAFPVRAAPASACSPTCCSSTSCTRRAPGPSSPPPPAVPSGSSSTRCRAMTARPRATSPPCWSRAPSSGSARSSSTRTQSG
jgi:hypothetical protein